MFKIGRVINYYEKVQMAIIELDGILALGDNITFIRNGDELFDLKIDLIQVGHTQIEVAQKGQVIALKVPNKITNGTYIYKKN